MKTEQAKPVKAPEVGEMPSGLNDLNITIDSHRARPYPPVKTSGIKTRGNGAAQRGVMARGPMG